MYIISLGAVHMKKNLDTHEGSMLSMATESINDAGYDSVPSLMTDTSSSSLPTSPTKICPSVTASTPSDAVPLASAIPDHPSYGPKMQKRSLKPVDLRLHVRPSRSSRAVRLPQSLLLLLLLRHTARPQNPVAYPGKTPSNPRPRGLPWSSATHVSCGAFIKPRSMVQRAL